MFSLNRFAQSIQPFTAAVYFVIQNCAAMVFQATSLAVVRVAKTIPPNVNAIFVTNLFQPLSSCITICRDVNWVSVKRWFIVHSTIWMKKKKQELSFLSSLDSAGINPLMPWLLTYRTVNSSNEFLIVTYTPLCQCCIWHTFLPHWAMTL